MGFNLSKMLMGFAKSSFKAATKKERKPLGDEYDFREEYTNEVDEWEAQVDSLNDIYNEWDYEQDPAPFRQRFDQEYAEIQEYLKTTVKTFLAEHSDGYRKSDINIIYKELVEQAKEIKADFMSEYPSMVSEYKEFLKEEEERRQEEEQEAAEWAAFVQSVLSKLQANNEAVKQKGFIDSFENKSGARQAINDLVEAGHVERLKKGGVYFIAVKQ